MMMTMIVGTNYDTIKVHPKQPERPVQLSLLSGLKLDGLTRRKANSPQPHPPLILNFNP